MSWNEPLINGHKHKKQQKYYHQLISF